GLAHRLAASLRAAIEASGHAIPDAQTPIEALAAIADEIEDRHRQAEKRLDTARGQRAQRELQRRQSAAREAALRKALGEARTALDAPLGGLLLESEPSIAVIRARLAEFDALLAAHERLAGAEAGARRAREALSLL